MILCEYGCGREAKYPPKKGMTKWCCESHYNKCPAVKKNNSIKNKNKSKKINLFERLFSKYPWFFELEDIISDDNNIKVRCKNSNCKNSKEQGGWFTPTKSQINERLRCLKTGFGNSFFYCCEECKEEYFKCYYSDILSKRQYRFSKGKENPMFGKLSPKKYTIKIINEKYLFFSKIEEMRYNPDKPGEKEIQVHCKNHNCPNSKEQGGWFTPQRRCQLSERIRQLEKDDGNGGCYFYCSEKCKNECPLFNLYSDPLKEITKSYTQSEYNQFRKFVFERDNYKCQYCGEKAEHVHHERPQKLEPFFALDPDYAISVCSKCHYKYGHKDECSTGNLANIICGD